jgi:hypothetical protein
MTQQKADQQRIEDQGNRADRIGRQCRCGCHLVRVYTIYRILSETIFHN